VTNLAARPVGSLTLKGLLQPVPASALLGL
jgi:hypothetical protein